MTKKNFILLSLDDSKAQDIANIVNNKSSKKILDFLADCNDSTESEIAKRLNLPISTVHYNLQQLVKTELVVIEEYHYSKKGKEINHYKLANKYIIIAPGKTRGLANKLRGIFPAFFVTETISKSCSFIEAPQACSCPPPYPSIPFRALFSASCSGLVYLRLHL